MSHAEKRLVTREWVFTLSECWQTLSPKATRRTHWRAVSEGWTKHRAPSAERGLAASPQNMQWHFLWRPRKKENKATALSIDCWLRLRLTEHKLQKSSQFHKLDHCVNDTLNKYFSFILRNATKIIQKWKVRMMSFTNANLPKPVMLNSCNSLAAAQELASAAGLDVPDASVFVWSFLLLWDRSSRAGNKDEETGTARDSAQEARFTWIQKWEKEVDWSGRRFFMFHILIPQKQTLSENMASSCHKVSDTHPLQIWPEGQWSHTSQRGVEIKFCPGWKR